MEIQTLKITEILGSKQIAGYFYIITYPWTQIQEAKCKWSTYYIWKELQVLLLYCYLLLNWYLKKIYEWIVDILNLKGIAGQLLLYRCTEIQESKCELSTFWTRKELQVSYFYIVTYWLTEIQENKCELPTC